MARMFTGLVEELATVQAARQTTAGRRLQSLKLALKAPLVAKGA
jgi:riboflavin synthase alpha subunit